MALHPWALHAGNVTAFWWAPVLAIASLAIGNTDVAVIRRLRESSNAAIARHDTAGIAAILASNVVVVTSTSAVMIGRDVNAGRFAEQFRAYPDVVYRRTPVEVTVYAPWRMASETGTWTGSWTEPDGKVAIGGHYFAKWHEVAGRWQVESETYVPGHCRGSTYCAVRSPQAPSGPR